MQEREQNQAPTLREQAEPPPELVSKVFPFPKLVDRGVRVNVCVMTPNPTRTSRFPLPNQTLAGGALPPGGTFRVLCPVLAVSTLMLH